MTVARAVLPLALCGAVSVLAALLIRHGQRGRHTGTQRHHTTRTPRPKEHDMSSQPFRILITGSRDWNDEAAISKALTTLAAANAFAEQPTVVVHGACPTGADRMADDWARWHARHSSTITIERHPADWNAHGRAAGPRRNAAMVAAGADACLAFIRNGSRGATGCADLAEQAGIPTRRYTA